jgi:NTP pyrophosphatase (non-canonical NTP hydrolase)
MRIMKKEMPLKEIQKLQTEFDKKYFSKYWEKPFDSDKKIEFLKDMTIALTGELGEFANVIKKINRDRKNLGEEPNKEMMGKLRDELTDFFKYSGNGYRKRVSEKNRIQS